MVDRCSIPWFPDEISSECYIQQGNLVSAKINFLICLTLKQIGTVNSFYFSIILRGKYFQIEDVEIKLVFFLCFNSK